MQSSSRPPARPTKEEWGELNKLFRGNANLVFLFEQLRIRNPVDRRKLTRKFDPAWIPPANVLLRRADRSSLKRLRLEVTENAVQLYELNIPNIRPRA